MEPAAELLPEISEPLTWAEICARYADQYVSLGDLDRTHPNGPVFRTARVVGFGPRGLDALLAAERNGYQGTGWRFTGKSTTPLRRPSFVLDDELRELLRRRR